MANYPFKINIKYKDGTTLPHYTSSFATDAETSISASAMVEKINLIPVGATYTQDSVAVAMHGSRKFGDANEGSKFISASYTHANTGSVIFTDTEDTDNDGLDFYTFWGTKVCNVLGLPEGIPIYTETFKLSDDSSNPSNYLSGDVIADGIAIKESFKIAPQGRMRSNLVWDHQFGEGFLQWVSGSASKLIFGYDNVADTYSLSAATAATFNISGVDSLAASTATITDIFTPEIHHVGGGLVVGKGATAVLYGESGTTTDHSFQAGNVIIEDGSATINGALYAQRDLTTTWDNESTDADYQIIIRNNTDTDGAFGGIAFQVENGFNADRINAAILAERVDGDASDVNSDLIFATNSDADDDLFERMRITSDGKVGIGTSSPVEKLHIDSGDIALTNFGHMSCSFDNTGVGYEWKLTTDTGAGGFGILLTSTTAVPLIHMQSDTDSKWTGIKFTDTDTDNAHGYLLLDRNSSPNASAFSGATQNDIVLGAANSSFVTIGTELTARWWMDTSGNILHMGRTTGAAEHYFTAAGVAHHDGDVIAYSSTIGSDIRLKENIFEISGSLDKVKKLRPIEFDWKKKIQRPHELGLIAQEVEKIEPLLVKDVEAVGSATKYLDGDGTYKTVDYAKLTILLIDAIKEQQKQIDELKKKL